MKIAFYNPTHITFLSGAEVLLVNMLPLIVEQGYDVTLYMTSLWKTTANEHVVGELEKSGVKIIELKSFRLPMSGSPIPIGFLSQLKKRYDFFYMYNGFAFQDLFGFIVSKMFRAKFIYGIIAPITTSYWLHNIYQVTVAKFIFKQSDMVHVLNKDDRDSISLINKKVFFLGLGIKKEFLLYDIPSSRLESSVLNVVFAGRLSEQKNILELLKVIKKMSQNNSIKFFICGDGEYRDIVIEYASQLSNLVYLGPTNKKLSEVFRDKHVFLNLSKYETFCLVIIEALANGLPVIATETRGICKDYGDNTLFSKIPLKFETDDVILEIERINLIFKNQKDEYRTLVDKAVAKASDFTWEEITNNFIKLFLTK